MINDWLWSMDDDGSSMAVGFAIGAVLVFLWSLWMDLRKK